MSESGLRVRLRNNAPVRLDADLSCAPGELLALVGASGSGKTTILRVIAGLLRVREGGITCGTRTWLDTHRQTYLVPQERRVGMVFQHYALFPHLTALDNVMEGLQDLPASRRRDVAMNWFGRLHLEGLERSRPNHLSGGQQQRVALARALARDPQVLLLDEPFSAVDRTTRERLYEELAGLRRELSMPVIMVTHDLDEALLLADRMSVLAGGTILQSGRPIEVMTRPRSPEVAMIVGQKNIFRGGVLEHAPERGVTIIEWRKRRLDARLQEEFAVGAQIAWTVPRSHLILLPAGPASENGRGNAVRGMISRLVRLGESIVVSIEVDGPGRPPVHMSIPVQVAQEREIHEGAAVAFAFLPDGIHLMHADRPQADSQARDSIRAAMT